MIEELTTNDAAEKAFEWQDSRRREDGHFDFPVQGFANGNMTLWLPSPAVNTRWIWRNGEPVKKIIESCMTRPEIVAVRDEVFKSARRNSLSGVCSIDVNFMKYTAAVIAINYNMSDDDLTDLLGGTRWHQQMFLHVTGGDDALEALQRINPRVLVENSPIELPPQTRRPGIASRILRRLKRG